MKSILAYVLEQVCKELEFLSNESIWADGYENKLVLRATSVAHDAQLFLESIEEYRKSSVYMDVKTEFKVLFNTILRIASRIEEDPSDRLMCFKQAVSDFKETKERVLASL